MWWIIKGNDIFRVSIQPIADGCLKARFTADITEVLSKIARGQQDNPGEEVASNKEFWWKKLARNVERDKEVNDQLTQQGWLVLRFWESDIKKDIGAVVAEIESYMA